MSSNPFSILRSVIFGGGSNSQTNATLNKQFQNVASTFDEQYIEAHQVVVDPTRDPQNLWKKDEFAHRTKPLVRLS
jgi:hypothetical protein